MATEKDIAFAVYLLKLAQEGKLIWETTASPNEFTTSLKGKYNVSVKKGGTAFAAIIYENSPEYTLRLVNQNEQELVRLTEHEYPDLVQLYDLARRASLNVDAVIDEILGQDL